MNKIKELLTALTEYVYLYTAKGNQSLPYIVYGKDGENTLSAGNTHAEKADSGYIDLYTNDEKDLLVAQIPQVLSDASISFFLNSVQYEEETGVIHYEWIWEE